MVITAPALEAVHVGLQRGNLTLLSGDLLLQIIDVLVVIRTRYGYACEAQNKGSSKEQIFDFFVHSTKNKIDKVDNT